MDYGKAVCDVCGKEFEKHAANHKHCSKVCAAKIGLERSMARSRRPDVREARAKQKRAARLAMRGGYPKCQQCGRVMRFKNARKYCSESCRLYAKSGQAAEYRK